MHSSVDVSLDVDRLAGQPEVGLGVAEGLHQCRLQRQASGVRVECLGFVVRLDELQSVHQLVGHGLGRAERDEPGRRGADPLLLRPEEHLVAGRPVGCDTLLLPDLQRPDQPEWLVGEPAAVHRQHLRPQHRSDRPDTDR
jgi:hypothetical protein